MYKTDPKLTPASPPLLNTIRIELPLSADDQLEEWAVKERRSKREHVAYMVTELLDLYRTDPLIMHRLKLGMVGRSVATA